MMVSNDRWEGSEAETFQSGGIGFDERSTTKACPRCGELLFSDMQVCYGCLYDFGRQGPWDAEPALPDPGETYDDGYGFWDEYDDVQSEGYDEEYGSDTYGEEYEEAWERSQEAPAPDGGIPAWAGDVEMPRGTEGDLLGGVSAPPDETAEWEAPMGRARDTRSSGLRVQTSDVDLVVPLPETGLSVGRQPDNDIVLHARAISRRHVVIEPGDGKGCIVRNVGAHNPPLLRGREVLGAAVLKSGDTVDLCGTRLTFVRGHR